MFDSIRNNKRLVQVFLCLISIPFAIWGLDFYTKRTEESAYAATVDKTHIPLAQFRENLRQQKQDSPDIRKALLDEMIMQQLLFQETRKNRMFFGEEALQSIIAHIPDFQENGQFSRERYKEVLASNGMTPESFEAQWRQNQPARTLVESIGVSAFTPKTVARQILALQSEVRDIQELLISWKDFSGKAKVSPEDLQLFYDQHKDRFQTPEKARVEFVVLEDAPEERRASHILLSTRDANIQEVRQEAERLLEEVRKTPERFAELAKKHSSDTRSAAHGGDLGFFPRGAMVKPFESAVFSMKEGEISDIVETDFGFHIIKLAQIKPGRFGENGFAQAEENFSNMVFDQPESLAPAAKQYQLPIHQSGWISRQGNLGSGIFENPEFLKAIFDDDVLKKGHNSKAVPLGQGLMASARILEYSPAALSPFESVKGEIEATLKRERATAMAIEAGQLKLANIQSEKAPAWSAIQQVSRMNPGQTNPSALPAIFKADSSSLPAHVGVEIPNTGYALYKISKVTSTLPKDEELRLFAREFDNLAARTQMEIYLASLRQRYPVLVNPKALTD